MPAHAMNSAIAYRYIDDIRVRCYAVTVAGVRTNRRINAHLGTTDRPDQGKPVQVEMHIVAADLDQRGIDITSGQIRSQPIATGIGERNREAAAVTAETAIGNAIGVDLQYAFISNSGAGDRYQQYERA